MKVFQPISSVTTYVNQLSANMKYAASLSAISLLHIGLHKACQPILAEPRIYIGADTRYSLHLRFDSVELLKMLMEIGLIEGDVSFTFIDDH